MTNLLEETIKCLEENGKRQEDVLWVGSRSYAFESWEDFAKIASKTDYSAGYGAEEIATDLVVVGFDFWLERHEYDGSEWWEFKEIPAKPALCKKEMILRAEGEGGWCSLEELNESKEAK